MKVKSWICKGKRWPMLQMFILKSLQNVFLSNQRAIDLVAWNVVSIVTSKAHRPMFVQMKTIE